MGSELEIDNWSFAADGVASIHLTLLIERDAAMARSLRLEFAGAIYHLLARGNERRRIFRGEADREQFLALLERSCARNEVSLLGFVLVEGT